MKYEAEYAGNWVATHDDKVVAYAKSLKVLRKKVKEQKGEFELKYALVPRGFMAG